MHYLLWVQWLLLVVLAGKDVVLCAMDETMIPFNFPSRRTNVVGTQYGHKDAVTANVTLNASKLSVSFIGTLCNHADLQPHLPQIIFPKATKKKDSEELQSMWTGAMPDAPKPIEVWKQAKGWMTSTLMAAYLGTLKRVIKKRKPGHTIVLVVDPHGAHISAEVLRYAARYFGHIVIIPSQLGWALDLLDSKVYSGFKDNLYHAITAKKFQSPTGTITKPEWAGIIFSAIHSFFIEREYTREFPRHGLGPDVSLLRDTVKALLGPTVLEAPRKLREAEFFELLGMERDVYRLLFEGTRFEHLDALGHPKPPTAPSSSAPLPRGKKLPGFGSSFAGIGG